MQYKKEGRYKNTALSKSIQLFVNPKSGIIFQLTGQNFMTIKGLKIICYVEKNAHSYFAMNIYGIIIL